MEAEDSKRKGGAPNTFDPSKQAVSKQSSASEKGRPKKSDSSKQVETSKMAWDVQSKCGKYYTGASDGGCPYNPRRSNKDDTNVAMPPLKRQRTVWDAGEDEKRHNKSGSRFDSLGKPDLLQLYLDQRDHEEWLRDYVKYVTSERDALKSKLKKSKEQSEVADGGYWF